MPVRSLGGFIVISTEAVSKRLLSKGVKPTKQRLEVGMLLLGEPQHLSADQILGSLRKSGSRISKATVYNTLNLFTNHGLLRELSVDSSRQLYDSTTHVHHHFYNVDTGELTDISKDDLVFSSLPELPEGTEAHDIEVIVRVRNK
jgi:Fur family iron response transcriptional regulator